MESIMEDNLVDFAVEIDNSLEAQWQHLTDMPRSPRTPLGVVSRQGQQGIPSNQQLDSTFISPPQSPQPSTRKADHSAQFRYEFQSLIQNNKHAKRKWMLFQKKYKAYCTNKRCIKLLISFCTQYGLEFEDLSKHGSYKKLGSRSNCHCSINSPLASSQLSSNTSISTLHTSTPISPPMSPLCPMSPLGTMSPLSPLGPLSPLSPLSTPASPLPTSPDNQALNSPYQFEQYTPTTMWNVPQSPAYMSFINSPPLPQQQNIPTVPPEMYTRPRAATYPNYPINMYVPHPTPTLPHLIMPSTHLM
eukprot:Phypoly_transcript_10380.p1 GENE.Phypoly_transcript_10380~~Phypoly_transcript_10380.p1  ORF type:complete len:303 (+),score=47.56 Phypoly_transcript_10380:338-1246(+)